MAGTGQQVNKAGGQRTLARIRSPRVRPSLAFNPEQGAPEGSTGGRAPGGYPLLGRKNQGDTLIWGKGRRKSAGTRRGVLEPTEPSLPCEGGITEGILPSLP